MCVYMIINDVNGKYYVGKTVSKDIQQYFRDRLGRAMAGATAPLRLCRAIRKYGPDKFRIHALMPTLKTDAELCHWETELIGLFKSQDPSIGYNIADGGQGAAGVQHSEQTRRRMSNAHLGKVLTLVQRQKISQSSRGKKKSASHRLHISQGRTGITFSEKHLIALSDAHKGNRPSEETLRKMSIAQIKRHSNTN